MPGVFKRIMFLDAKMTKLWKEYPEQVIYKIPVFQAITKNRELSH
uniref:Uncharacterized protein n=1 Tax=Candidatus Kentrum sp. DK TaxID=2126562 RepID=A0A450TKE3_9GAMM|nr:MAG: hypothetical protein BECKDK2373C_GA0170839_11001 [Candidatus Kentron sp. DK]VFJ67947.1 MAG: hypothetical protein BECKDK2373B_GA0170837_12032 [Candidatus Kentron sp. DK]